MKRTTVPGIGRLTCDTGAGQSNFDTDIHEFLGAADVLASITCDRDAALAAATFAISSVTVPRTLYPANGEVVELRLASGQYRCRSHVRAGQSMAAKQSAAGDAAHDATARRVHCGGRTVMNINIQFDANATDVWQAQIPVEVINAKMESTWHGTMPLSRGTSVSVSEPGVYLVRATLPSGELMASTVRLTENQTTTANLRPPKQSPNEELAWAYYMQRVPSQSGWRARGPMPNDRWFMEEFAKVPGPPLPVCEFWAHGRGNLWRPAQPSDLRSQPVSINPGDPTALMATEVYSINNAVSVWALIRWPGGHQLVAIPAWNLQHIRMLILREDPTDGDSTPFRVLVGGNHPQTESILGFLTSGDFEAARRVGENWFDEAEQMLRDKVDDPIAAIVAGYFLLRAGSFDRLHDWTSNLANWFPSFSDGAVICGWHMALSNRWELAEHWFTEAVQRGIPLYTQGLRLLHDGLRLLAGRGANVEESFDRIRPSPRGQSGPRV